MENMTYAEAIASGYVEADRKYTRSYVSRKIRIEDQPVKLAGGNRKGQLYVLAPCFTSSQYCYRVYLTRR